MSNINETKQNTAEVEAVTRAKMAEKNDADVKQGSSAKKFLMAILVIAIIVALALLVINAVIDSYANAFVPFLIPHYNKVYVVDPRHYKGTLTEFCENKQVNDVIVLTNISTTRNYVYLEGLENFVQ
jgi:hypothetical protein